MKVIEPKNGSAPVKMWTDGVPVEDEAVRQLENVAALPFIYKHVAAMPDVHVGMGATIGSVIPTVGAVIPAAVGVDIGCGMLAVMTDWVASDMLDNLPEIRGVIEKTVPHGRTNHGGPGDVGAWSEIPAAVEEIWGIELKDQFEQVTRNHPKIAQSNHINHLGTLGTGNHFIEVCLDEKDRVWIMLHSGSRGVGNRIGSYFIARAKANMKTWMINTPDMHLAYLPEGTQDFQDYMLAVSWAQLFAGISRDLMMISVQAATGLGGKLLRVSCHHNYVAKENHFGKNIWVTRKGAVSARDGELGIIPGSMGAKSFIVEGKGNRESFNSCSHGAGRKMSRTAARKTFTVEDHEKATAGIECRKDVDVLDETPGSYKDIDAVMAAQSDLVEIKHTLRQVVCVKG